VDVQIHPEEDQGPEDRSDDRRDPRLQGVKVGPVVMRGSDDAADDQVEGE
jgi:hypothetical protein